MTRPYHVGMPNPNSGIAETSRCVCKKSMQSLNKLIPPQLTPFTAYVLDDFGFGMQRYRICINQSHDGFYISSDDEIWKRPVKTTYVWDWVQNDKVFYPTKHDEEIFSDILIEAYNNQAIKDDEKARMMRCVMEKVKAGAVVLGVVSVIALLILRKKK